MHYFRAWMTGKTFNRNGKEFKVIEGSYKYIDGNLRNTVRFIDTEIGKGYTMTEEEFFDKVAWVLQKQNI